MLEKFIARQPIFDDKLKLFGYELLFRASSENVFRPYKAASEILIVDSTSLFGLQSLTGHAKAFVNLDLLARHRASSPAQPDRPRNPRKHHADAGSRPALRRSLQRRLHARARRLRRPSQMGAAPAPRKIPQSRLPRLRPSGARRHRQSPPREARCRSR